VLVYDCTDIMLFQNPPYKASRQLDPADHNCRYLVQPPTVPSLARLRVTNGHRVEVEVGADGPASAPPSGVAAAAPPAGAVNWEVRV
jgi:hypothetical protein